MTANQLQYAANQIEQEKADENARHNVKMEDENNRHNLSLEGIQQAQTDIQSRAQEETERHNKAMEDIQSRYNQLYLQLQEYQGNAKIAIENQLKDLEAEKQAEVARHNRENEELTLLSQDIQYNHEKEIQRHNVELEKLQSAMNRINEREADIKAKQQLAQSLYWSQSITQQELVSLRNYTLGLKEIEQRQNQTMLGIYELNQRQKEWKDMQPQRDVNVFATLAGGVGSLIGGAARGIGGLIGPSINLGTLYTKTGGF